MSLGDIHGLPDMSMYVRNSKSWPFYAPLSRSNTIYDVRLHFQHISYMYSFIFRHLTYYLCVSIQLGKIGKRIICIFSNYCFLFIYFFPLIQNAYFYLSLSLLFLLASSLVFHMIFLSEAFSWVPKWTHHQLLVTGVS